MPNIELLILLTEYAKKYNQISSSSLIVNNHMNEIKKDEVI
jgi:hypothetical protein